MGHSEICRTFVKQVPGYRGTAIGRHLSGQAPGYIPDYRDIPDDAYWKEEVAEKDFNIRNLHLSFDQYGPDGVILRI